MEEEVQLLPCPCGNFEVYRGESHGLHTLERCGPVTNVLINESSGASDGPTHVSLMFNWVMPDGSSGALGSIVGDEAFKALGYSL